MSWKDIIKAPFDVKARSNEAMENSINQLDAKLEIYLDSLIDEIIQGKPFQSTFTVPMEYNKHQQLVKLAGGSEQLQFAIQRMYNIKSVEFKPGAVPGHTEGKMAYWIEK
jgi:hypothetical protein